MDESAQRLADPAWAIHAAAKVAAIEARGSKHETPCGTGHIVWRRWGEGSPVVLFHGGAGAWSHWIRNVLPLSQHHTVWALDIPGLGESAAPETISVEAIASEVERGLSMLVPDGLINVVGFSFGSSIATITAAKLKERLCNFVLVSARFALFPKRPNPHTVSWKKFEDPAERLAAHRKNLEILMIAHPQNIDDLALYLQATNTPRARYFGPMLKPRSLDKLHEYLPQVIPQGRITAISGRLDRAATLIIDKQEAALQAIHPNAQFHIIENAGHWVQYEAAEQFNALLLDALSECG